MARSRRRERTSMTSSPIDQKIAAGFAGVAHFCSSAAND
jgi:hypothetical protein